MPAALLVNLGTPDAPTTVAVRSYLAEFLWDSRVIDIHPVARALLLYGAILPFRPAKSAAAYQAIWSDEGSPLLLHTQALRDRVAAELGPEWHVEMGMRYGRPSFTEALDRIQAQGIDDIVVLPLYPQYASSSTGTALEAIYKEVAERAVVPNFRVVPWFYDDPLFLDALAAKSRQHLDDFKPDAVLFSFHGLPERHVAATAPEHCKFDDKCCSSVGPSNRACYRAQCFATARGVAERLNLERWSVSFQSRLGRTPWIRPFTDEVVPTFATEGVQRLAVLCPSFVADCLETLEEIGIRARDSFRAAGGDELHLIPCLNDEPQWSAAVATLIRRTLEPV